MLNQIDLFVDIQGLQRVEQLVVAHLIDEIAPDVFRCLEQHLAAFVVADQLPERITPVVRQRFEGIGKVRWRQVRDQHLDLRQIVCQRAVVIAFSKRQFSQQRRGDGFIGGQQPDKAGALFIT